MREFVEKGLTHSIFELIVDFHRILKRLKLVDANFKEILGHLCVVFQFNELEMYSWFYTILLVVHPQNALQIKREAMNFHSLDELVMVAAVFCKAIMSWDEDCPMEDHLV